MVPYENCCLFAYLGLVSGRQTRFTAPAIVLNFFIFVCCNLHNPLPNVSFCSDDTAYHAVFTAERPPFSLLDLRPSLIALQTRSPPTLITATVVMVPIDNCYTLSSFCVAIFNQILARRHMDVIQGWFGCAIAVCLPTFHHLSC